MSSSSRILGCIVVLLSSSACELAGAEADTPQTVGLVTSELEGESHGHDHGHDQGQGKHTPPFELTRYALSHEFASIDPPLPGGIAGGQDVFFVGSPLVGRVQVFSRATRRPIAELPQPPTPFILPLIMHAIGPQRIAVLDSGGFPAPGTVDANPTIYEYEYTFTAGRFRAELARTVSFAGIRIGFAEAFAYLGDGQYLVPDSVYGAIWRVAPDGSIHPGIVPETFEPEDAIPELVFCPTMPVVLVGGLPFLFTDATIPGVNNIAERRGTVYIYSSCTAALYKFPLAILRDGRQPWERADSIEFIAGKSPNIEVEELLDMQFNPFDLGDKYLYAANALQLQFIRIDSHTGARQVLGNDPRLFNFPSSLAFLPPRARHKPAPILVLSNQQHRDPLLNSEISSDLRQLPYVITAVQVR